MPTARNLLNLKEVEKGYGSRSVLRELTLGVSAGERIGIVGQNGGGKSTLLRLIAGVEQPDAGALIRAGDVDVALLGQRDDLGDHHRSARRSSARAPITSGLETARSATCSTGCSAASSCGCSPRASTRRSRGCREASAGASALARLLLDAPELLLLDEPTNHLDVEGVDWLARPPRRAARLVLVVTHDRWFLDAVCTSTWEVADGACTSTRAATPRTCSRAPSATARSQRARTAAASSCARSSRGCGAGRPRARPSPSSASTPPTR